MIVFYVSSNIQLYLYRFVQTKTLQEEIKMFEQIKTTGCACGREHRCSVKKIITGSGAIKNLPECLDILKAERAFVVTDKNTLKAAELTIE